MAYVAISRVRLRKHWGRDCPTWHFNSFCACVYNRCLPIRGENDHLFALYESILKRMTWRKFFFFCLIFKKMSKLTRLNSKLPSSSHSYQDWTFISDVHGLILVTSVVPSISANTPGKKTFLTQLQYCFLLKTWYPKDKKAKIMNKKLSCFVY